MRVTIKLEQEWEEYVAQVAIEKTPMKRALIAITALIVISSGRKELTEMVFQ